MSAKRCLVVFQPQAWIFNKDEEVTA